MAVRLSALRAGPRFTTDKHYFSASDTQFCYRLSKPQGLLRPEGLGKLIKTNNSPLRVSNPRPSGLQNRALLLITVNVVLSSPILVTLMMKALRSSETSVLTRATWRNIQEDAILHSHRHENLTSYVSGHLHAPTALSIWERSHPPVPTG
jgi:hypothetical protein